MLVVSNMSWFLTWDGDHGFQHHVPLYSLSPNVIPAANLLLIVPHNTPNAVRKWNGIKRGNGKFPWVISPAIYTLWPYGNQTWQWKILVNGGFNKEITYK